MTINGLPQELLCLDTTLTIYQLTNSAWVMIGKNDDWQEGCGLFPPTPIPLRFQQALAPSDAACLLDLEGGAYTVIMGCYGGATGIGLIGVNTVD